MAMLAADGTSGKVACPLFYIVDWLPPDFGAVGQHAVADALKMAAAGREIHLVGLTRGEPSCETIKVEPVAGVAAGTLTIRKLHAASYEKSDLLRRLLWSVSTNSRLVWSVLVDPASRHADVEFTGAPPFMLYFVFALKVFRKARLIYRITDFYPEVIIAHLGRRPPFLTLIERFTWWLRRRVDAFEAIGEDQRAILERGGITPERIVVARYAAPIAISPGERPAPRPPSLAGYKVLLYSGNYGVAHEVETVVAGLARHHSGGSGRFALWLNATGQSADLVQTKLTGSNVPVARTAPVAIDALPALLAAADVHLITLRAQFAGIVFPSKVYACIASGRPILFVGPSSSDVHLLCSRAPQRYIRVEPGDAKGFAEALEVLAVGQ